jgi:hypothetical protein
MRRSEKERTHQSEIQIALIIAAALLVVRAAFILAKAMVKGRQRALGPSQRCSTLFIESVEQHGRGILSYG